jgi:hypothetical protein
MAMFAALNPWTVAALGAYAITKGRKRKQPKTAQVSGHSIASSASTIDATGNMTIPPGRAVKRNHSGRAMPTRIHPAVLSGPSIASGHATIDASGEMRAMPSRARRNRNKGRPTRR